MKKILRNNEDLLKFMRGMYGWESTNYPTNMGEAHKWLKVNMCLPPKKYPCHVEFTSETVEIDDGVYTKNKLTYTYEEDYEREIDLVKKNLNELKTVNIWS